ncbi:hypothetical protein [Pseudomonas sp. ERMR1:02]|uniref:hypothetical protein n=1 Tax=unclassified Pseudomonas TaxID=196821 RepID=UPI00353154C5
MRHPDMPPAVFGMMWSYLKAGKSWMGIVKIVVRMATITGSMRMSHPFSKMAT